MSVIVVDKDRDYTLFRFHLLYVIYMIHKYTSWLYFNPSDSGAYPSRKQTAGT